MGDVDDYDFSSGDAGAAHTFASEAGQIRVGGHMCIKGKPCKVLSVSTSKTGKHGHAKCNFTAQDIFTGKKCEDIVPSTHSVQVPNVTRKEYTLVDISDDGFLSLMDDAGETREDVKLPDGDLAFDIKGKFENESDKEWIILVLGAMGHEQVIQIKAGTA